MIYDGPGESERADDPRRVGKWLARLTSDGPTDRVWLEAMVEELQAFDVSFADNSQGLFFRRKDKEHEEDWLLPIADLTQRRLVYAGRPLYWDPWWAPDGQSFIGQDESGAHRFYLGGRVLRQVVPAELFPHFYSPIAWAPSGKQIVLCVFDEVGGQSVRIADAEMEGGAPREIHQLVGDTPLWSPDGAYILVQMAPSEEHGNRTGFFCSARRANCWQRLT